MGKRQEGGQEEGLSPGVGGAWDVCTPAPGSSVTWVSVTRHFLSPTPCLKPSSRERRTFARLSLEMAGEGRVAEGAR